MVSFPSSLLLTRHHPILTFQYDPKREDLCVGIVREARGTSCEGRLGRTQVALVDTTFSSFRQRRLSGFLLSGQGKRAVRGRRTDQLPRYPKPGPVAFSPYSARRRVPLLPLAAALRSSAVGSSSPHHTCKKSNVTLPYSLSPTSSTPLTSAAASIRPSERREISQLDASRLPSLSPITRSGVNL